MKQNSPVIGIVGAGGLGRVMYDLLTYQDYNVKIFIDDNSSFYSNHVCGIPVYSFNELNEKRIEEVVIAILDPKDRENVVAKVIEKNIKFGRIISRSTFISPYASLGIGNTLLEQSFVMNKAELGDYVHVHVQSIIGHDVIVGPYTTFGPSCIIGGFTNIGKGVTLGMGVKVLPKISIGDYSIVGAGSVVTKPVPAGEVWGGIPAKRLGFRS